MDRSAPDMTDEQATATIARAIDEAGTVVALTGAGVSTASGIPDFRGENGIWERHDPAAFHFDRFERDPAGFWVDRLGLHESLYGEREIDPNGAHEALAALESMGHLDALVTQNTDGLHHVAGSETVLELHGNARQVVCIACGERVEAAPIRERVRMGETPPRCECGGVYKPAVVLFGEALPRDRLARSRRLAERADVFLVAGSSLTVEPAASLPRIALDHGATLALFNLDRTPLSEHATHDLRVDVTDALPRLSVAVRDEH
jgi:NAD-dependent deacetylase